MPQSQFCLLTVEIFAVFCYLVLVLKGHFHQFSLMYDRSFETLGLPSRIRVLFLKVWCHLKSNLNQKKKNEKL